MYFKILLTIHHELDPNAGAAGATLNLGQAYQNLGHQIYYYSFDNLPPWFNIKTKALLFPWFVAFHIFYLCWKQNLDVIDSSTGDAWVWSRVRHLLNHKNTPLLVTRAHGLEQTVDIHFREEARRDNLNLGWKYLLYGGGFHLWEVKTSLKYADQTLQLNRHDLDYSVEQLGVKQERAKVVANGIPEPFLNLPFEPTPLEQNSILRIALVATYSSRKGIRYSVPALNSILLRHPHVRVSFLGTGVTAEVIYRDFRPELCDRVQVIPFYRHEILPTLLIGHHIKLFPSLTEGFSLALLEAMACGLAPIATSISGSMELIQDRCDGLLVPTGDIQAIEDRLEILVTEREYLNMIRSNAYVKAQSYSWTSIGKSTLFIYKEVIEKQKNHSSAFTTK